MQCKKCQELILTDYLDGEIEEVLRNSLEAHLASCEGCRKYLEIAQKTVQEPLENAKRDVIAPDVIWSRVQDEIRAAHEYETITEEPTSLIERLRTLIFMPRPAFALATVMAIVMTFFVWHSSLDRSHLVKNGQTKKQIIVKKIMESTQKLTDDEIEYYAFYFEQNESYSDYGTSMEEYFL